MRVRIPAFDFTGMMPVWAPNREFAHNFNASGIIPSAIEPFLIKVMRRAKAELDPIADAELISDIDVFNKQEAQHYKMHERFNQMIADNGYPRILEFDQRMKDEYAEMLESRSLEWLLGYCEGFESLAASGAEIWVDDGWGDYLEGADTRAVELWRWHLAEEYEHRTVVHRVYHRLCEGTPEEVFRKRMELFEFCTQHMFGHTSKLRSYLLETDRASMTEEERAESLRREEEFDARNAAGRVGLQQVLAPSWDPASLTPPRRVAETLAAYAS